MSDRVEDIQDEQTENDETEKDSRDEANSDRIEHFRPGEENEESDWKSGEPLPEADKAEIDSNKFENYSMNPDNPNNQGKWQAYEQLGYDVHSESGRGIGAKDVTAQLRTELPNAPAKEAEESPYGDRYEVRTPITGPNGREGTLVTYWQVDNGSDNPKMITNWLEVHKQEE